MLANREIGNKNMVCSSYKDNTNKKGGLFVVALLLFGNSYGQIEGRYSKETFMPREVSVYVFVSHSMSDGALKAYFKEARANGATLVVRGLINDSFMETKAKCEDLQINYDVNPVLFDDYGIKVVPTIISEEKKWVKKITGHIPLIEALRIFREELR